MADEVAIVTGGARGIGGASARALAEAGVRVCVADLDAEAAGATADALVDAGHVALAATLDVTDPESCAAAVRLAADELGPPTMLVNNAGATRSGFLHKMSDADWDLVNDVVLRGPFNATRAVAPWFRDGEPSPAGRRVVNIASIAAVYGATAGANYCAAKAGVIGLTKAMAAEWAPYRVTVNAVAPGLIDTRMLGESIPERMHAAMARRIPLGRLGAPDDVAGAVGYLCSPGAAYVTGQVIEVGGGFTDLTPPGDPVS